MEQEHWNSLSLEVKKIQIYLKQRGLFELFLQIRAISKAHYDKSFGDLTDKMGMQKYAGEQADSIAMTNKLNNGRYINEYDYETCYSWYANENGSWSRGTVATKS